MVGAVAGGGGGRAAGLRRRATRVLAWLVPGLDGLVQQIRAGSVVISLRYHAVSIAAVFLALARRCRARGQRACPTGCCRRVVDEADDLDGQVQTLHRRARRPRRRPARRRRVRRRGSGPAAVRGLLAGRTVALVTVGRRPGRPRRGRRRCSAQAGATVTGEVALTPAVGDPARADQLRELTAQLLPTGAQLPAASDTGSLVGGLLGGRAARHRRAGRPPPSRPTPVLTGLAAAGFVDPGPRPQPAELVLVLTGGALARASTPATPPPSPPGWPPQLDRAGGGRGAGRADRLGRRHRRRRRGPGRPRRSPQGCPPWTTCRPGPGRCRRCWRCASSSTGAPGRYGTAVTAADGAAPAA